MGHEKDTLGIEELRVNPISYNLLYCEKQITLTEAIMCGIMLIMAIICKKVWREYFKKIIEFL